MGTDLTAPSRGEPVRESPPSTPPWPGLVERPARGQGGWPADVLVVFVHGAMDRGAGMAQMARHLRDAPTLRYDRRGYGRAVDLGVGGLVTHVDDLVGLTGHRPTVLFGHSFGGLVALAMAASGRGDVRGVVTWEAPTPWIDDWHGWRLADPGDDVDDPAAAVAEAFMRRAAGPARWAALPEATRSARRREGPALLADMDPLLTAGPPFDPTRIDVPCVFGVGDRPGAAYARGAAWLADRITHASVTVIPGATHDAPRTHAPELASLLRDVAGATGAGTAAPGTAPKEAHDARPG